MSRLAPNPRQTSTLFVPVVYGASMILLAAGLSRGSSVVRRHPVGVSAMVLLALWPIIGMLAIPGMMTPPTPGDPTMLVLGLVSLAVPLAAAVVAALYVSRSGVVPLPWRWAPLWAAGAVVVLHVIAQGLMLAVGPEQTQALAAVFVAFETAAYLVHTAGLGILAVVLAAQPQPAPRELHAARPLP